MALTYLPAAQANAGVSAMFPTSTFSHTATATNGTTTLTFAAADALSISIGDTLTGAGITGSATVTANTGTVITITGTISTLTATSYVFTRPVYGGLHTGSPSTTGANEAIADYTTRPSVTFGAPSSGVELSTNSQTWTCATGFTATYFSYWTQATTGGTYLGGGTLTSLTIPSGALVTAAVGAISATLSG